jgi:hypothetical protein
MIRGFPAALAAIAFVAAAAPALACNEASHVQAAHAHGRGVRPPLVIGDSTLIISAPTLGRMGIEADAHGCRQFSQGVGIVASRPRHLLPDAVVLALGANGAISPGQVGHARAVLGRHRFLLLVTPRNLHSSAALMRAAARGHPDRVLTLDWAAFSAGHGSWFAGDSLHVNATGARAYAGFIRAGLEPFLGTAHQRQGLGLPTRVDAPGVAPCGSLRSYGRTVAVFITRGAKKMDCAHARRHMAGPRLHPFVGWAYHDWRTVGRGPWTDVMVRRQDRAIVLAGIEPARAPH